MRNLEQLMVTTISPVSYTHLRAHPDVSTPFLRSQTLLSVNKMEIEANTFAVKLLIPDDIIRENRDLTTQQLSRLLGYEQALIELRVKSYIQA